MLAALSGQDRQRLLARCQQVQLPFADVLYKPGERIRHVFFPTDSFISLVTSVDGNAHLEIGLVGDEGMLGTSLMLDVDTSPIQAVVQGAEYLGGSAPFQERIHILGLIGRFTLDHTALVAQWARWARAEIERWPDVGSGEVSPDVVRAFEAALADLEAGGEGL